MAHTIVFEVCQQARQTDKGHCAQRLSGREQELGLSSTRSADQGGLSCQPGKTWIIVVYRGHASTPFKVNVHKYLA